VTAALCGVALPPTSLFPHLYSISAGNVGWSREPIASYNTAVIGETLDRPVPVFMQAATVEMEKVPTQETTHIQSRKWHRTGVTTSVTVGVLVTVALAIPAVIHHSSYRDVILNQALQEHGLSGQSVRSTGGWLTEFEYHDITFTGAQDQIQGHVEVLKTGKSIVSHVLGSLPTVTFIRPKLKISLDDNGRLPLDSGNDDGDGSFAFETQDAEIVLEVPWRELPIVEIDDIDLRGRIEQTEDGRWLSLDAVDVLKQAKLSDRHTEQNLALVAPVLSQTTSLSGEVSARINPLRIRIDDAAPKDQSLLSGSVQVHSLNAQLRKKWSRDIINIVSQFSQTPVSAEMDLVSQSTVDFEVRNDGIYHSGFSLLLPDVSNGLTVTSSGMLYLDETVDLALNIQMPMLSKSGNPFLNMIAKVAQAPMQLRVTGTVSDPKIVTSDGVSLPAEIANRIDPALHVENSNSVAGAVNQIIQAGATETAEQRKRKLPGRIFGLIRSIEAAKKTGKP